MFVTKKGLNLRHAPVKKRNNIIIPKTRKDSDEINCDFHNMKESCKKKLREASKKSEKSETSE